MAAEIYNVDRSGGLLPIELGHAYTETEEHLLLVHYDISTLHNSLTNLQTSFVRLKLRLKEKSSQILNELLNTIEADLGIATEKLQNLQPRKDIETKRRTRRGLVNGLGSVIKFITGNLDDEDRKKYDKIIKTLSRKDSQTDMKLNKEHRLMTDLMRKYNDTIATLNSNNREIRDKLRNQFNAEFNSSRLREIAFQIITNLNIIINQQRELENSLTFCKIGITHPSVVPLQTFESELMKIAQENHKTKLKMFNSTVEYELNSKIACSLHDDQIFYIIRIPCYIDTGLKLYLLQPVPIAKDNGYVTIIPKNKFILINKNYAIEYSTNELCYRTNNNEYYCNEEILCKESSNCSQNIIKQNTLSGCQFTKIRINDPFHSLIPESGHIIISSSSEIILEDKKPEGNILHRIRGTWIVQPSTDEILLNNTLISSKSSTYSKLRIPLIPLDEISSLDFHPLEINLKEFSKLPQFDERWPSLINDDTITDYVHILVSPLYILVLIVLTIFFIAVTYKKCKSDKTETITHPVSYPLQFVTQPLNSAQYDPRVQ